MDHNQHRFSYIDVFATSLFVGTSAAISASPQPLSAQAMQQSVSLAATQPATSAPAYCFLWPESKTSYRLYCFNARQLIQCCGHGLLAAAHYLKPHLPRYFLVADNRLPVRYQPTVAVGLPRLGCDVIAIPDWLNQVFDAHPLTAAFAGDEQGYLILHFDDDITLPLLRPRLERLQQYSQRAIIVTQWLGQQEADYGLRYFAPQYGVDEDVVTGSAQRVLADYWQQYQPQTHYRVRQFSPGGGLLQVSVEDDYIYLSEAERV
ncbi:hypothetical protein SIN8267_00661 [Sinobacterium norvegicum]|uniref:Uncharacterized protein n=1 Tax=Sinobacterium norvegicum TaxID=1641715 RepID=A0ABM9AC77_9GAMM|nr:PhzF family phenazine biosynthesis protein [Sinobacterium norvegicum]CAH0990568.1 hypothetical protein SIN8267_00661 [Sinobacterium norvegicum]